MNAKDIVKKSLEETKEHIDKNWAGQWGTFELRYLEKNINDALGDNSKKLPKIEMLVGPIASGKSTYCLQRGKEGAIVINDDSLLTSIHGGNYMYQKDLITLYKHLEMMILHSAVSMGRDVVIDKTNLTKARRIRYVGIAKSLEIPIFALVFKDYGVHVHVSRRMAHDTRGYPREKWVYVYQEHAKNFEPVSTDEGFHEIIYKG